MAKKCSGCGQFTPFPRWDWHQRCPKCRPCAPSRTCVVCRQWAKDRWLEVQKWLTKKVREQQLKGESSAASVSLQGFLQESQAGVSMKGKEKERERERSTVPKKKVGGKHGSGAGNPEPTTQQREAGQHGSGAGNPEPTTQKKGSGKHGSEAGNLGSATKPRNGTERKKKAPGAAGKRSTVPPTAPATVPVNTAPSVTSDTVPSTDTVTATATTALTPTVPSTEASTSAAAQETVTTAPVTGTVTSTTSTSVPVTVMSTTVPAATTATVSSVTAILETEEKEDELPPDLQQGGEEEEYFEEEYEEEEPTFLGWFAEEEVDPEEYAEEEIGQERDQDQEPDPRPRERRSRRHGEKKKKKKRKRRYSSDSSSSSSGEERPSKRSRRDSSTDTLLGQIKDLVANQIKEALAGVGTTQAPQPTQPVAPAPSAPAARQPEEALADQEESSEDETLIRGTDISQEAFEKAVAVVREVLGFEPPQQQPRTGPASRLSLGDIPSTSSATIPVDVECVERFQTVAAKKKWRHARRRKSVMRLDEEAWKELFVVPGVPDIVREELRRHGVLDRSGNFTDPTMKKMNKALMDIDAASREGLRYASAFMLFAEVITKAYETANTMGISRKNTGAIATMLGPTSRVLFDQLARISVRSTSERRSMVIENMSFASESVKKRFLELPMSGNDLFGGKFDDHLKEEADKAEAMKKATTYLSKVGRYYRGRPRGAFRSRTRSQASTGRGTGTTRSQPYSTRGSATTTTVSARGRAYQPYRQRRSLRGRARARGASSTRRPYAQYNP